MRAGRSHCIGADPAPDTVETSLGALHFFDGLPDKATIKKVYDNLDLIRGVDVFLNARSATSTLANIDGLKSVGCDNFAAVIHENRVDARTLLLTPNCDSNLRAVPYTAMRGFRERS